MCQMWNNYMCNHSNPNSVPLCHYYNNCRFGNNCKFRHITFTQQSQYYINTTPMLTIYNNKQILIQCIIQLSQPKTKHKQQVNRIANQKKC